MNHQITQSQTDRSESKSLLATLTQRAIAQLAEANALFPVSARPRERTGSFQNRAIIPSNDCGVVIYWKQHSTWNESK